MSTTSERFAFLGREFLTWLWFAAEAEALPETVETPSGAAEVFVEFGQRLVVESGGNIRETTTVQAEAPTQTEDARTALRSGKKLAKARLTLTIGERFYELTLDANLAISGLKTPRIDARDTPYTDLAWERMALLVEAEAAVHDLYRHFVLIRADKHTWALVRDRMRQWVQDGEA